MLILSDEQLVTDYLNGNNESLGILIKRYLKPIYGFVFSYAGNTQDAEDITQDVFVKVWKNLNQFDQQKNFKTWIFSIAKNTALDFLKKKKTIPFAGLNIEEEGDIYDNIADPAPLTQEILEQADLSQILASAMDKLALPYRTILFLYYSNQFNFREIAELLGESIDTVKSRHRRALMMLKKFIARP